MADFMQFVEANLIICMIWLALLVTLIATELNKLLAGYKSITPQELTRMINRDEATVIDVSAITEYQAGHIINAKHMLLQERHDRAVGREKAQERRIYQGSCAFWRTCRLDRREPAG
jgi:Rhodanese-like domain